MRWIYPHGPLFEVEHKEEALLLISEGLDFLVQESDLFTYSSESSVSEANVYDVFP